MSDDHQDPSLASQEILEKPDALVLGEMSTLPAGNGWQWIRDGFDLFKLGPAVWIGMTLVYFLIAICLSLLPFLSFVSTVLTPVFGGGFVLACWRSEQKGAPDFADLFAGFKEKLWPLVNLGIIILLAWIVVIFVAGVSAAFFIDVEAFEAALADWDGEESPDIPGIMAFMVVFALLSLPVMMGQWLAPALVVMHDIKPWQAFLMSMKALWRNKLPALIYGVVMMAFGIAATIPFMLGWLLFFPLLMTSMYAAYLDIFAVRRQPTGIA